MEITKTTEADTTTYRLTDGDKEISFLAVVTTTRVVANVETVSERQGEGHARTLWEHANAEAEVFHQLEHHRTFEGDAFAQAMGGETADEADDYCEHCIICTGDDC